MHSQNSSFLYLLFLLSLSSDLPLHSSILPFFPSFRLHSIFPFSLTSFLFILTQNISFLYLPFLSSLSDDLPLHSFILPFFPSFRLLHYLPILSHFSPLSKNDQSVSLRFARRPAVNTCGSDWHFAPSALPRANESANERKFQVISIKKGK